MMKSLIRGRELNLLMLISVILTVLLPNTLAIIVEAKIFLSLLFIFVLPGYVLFNIIAKDRFSKLDFLERAVTYLGVSLGLMLIPWVLGYFAKWPVVYLSLAVRVFDIVGLSFLLVRGNCRADIAPQRDESPLSWKVALVSFILIVILAAYFYGPHLTGDAYSYMTLLKNIYSGDVSLQSNIHASWESEYPLFKSVRSVSTLLYAMCAKATGVDPNLVWVRVPAFFTFFLLAVNYSLTKYIFKKRSIAYIAIFITPIVCTGLHAFNSSIGESSNFPTAIPLPLAILFSLWYILGGAENRLYLYFAALLGVFLVIEHFPHFVYLLLALGAFGFVRLVLKRCFTPGVKRVIQLVALIILLASPYLLLTASLAHARAYDAAANVELKFQRGAYHGPSTDFFIIRPLGLLGGYTGYPAALLALLGILCFFTPYYKTKGGNFLLANVVVILFIGLNPWLVPFLSRLLAPQTIYRMGSFLPVVPLLSFALFRSTIIALRAFRRWREGARVKAILGEKQIWIAGLLLVLTLPAFGYQVLYIGRDAIQIKAQSILYSPAGANPIWLDRKLRAFIESEISSPPYPIFEKPVRLNRFLDQEVINFIQVEIDDNSVFLSERLTEYMLPAYTNQLAFLGRLGWPKWGDVCPEVREKGAMEAFPLELEVGWYPAEAVSPRLEMACEILNPDADPRVIENLLLDWREEIDYILVTPSTHLLMEKLDGMETVKLIYDHDGFAIFELE